MDEWHQPVVEILHESECVSQLAYCAAKGTDLRLNVYGSSGLIIMNLKRQIET